MHTIWDAFLIIGLAILAIAFFLFGAIWLFMRAFEAVLKWLAVNAEKAGEDE